MWKILIYWVLQMSQKWTHKKITSVNMAIDLIRKVFICWETVKRLVVGTSFPKFWLLFEESYFIIGNKCCQLSSFYSFLWKYLLNTQMWITLVWQAFFSSKNGVPWKHNSVRNSNSSSTSFCGQSLYFTVSQKCFIRVYFIHRILRRWVGKDRDLVTLMTLCCFIKNS